jgi:hypothetical protein
MTPSPSTGTSSRESEAGFSRPVSEFLVGWAMALHRFAMYPQGHPSLAPVAERMLVQFGAALAGRPALPVGVLLHQLVVGGKPSPEGHPVLSDLAGRLHGHELGAVIFRRGLELDELTEALEVLARDPIRGERPLGRLPARDRPSWPHLSLLPVDYDALETVERSLQDPAGSVRDLWLALFRSTLRGLRGEAGRAGHGEDEDVPDPGGGDGESLRGKGPLPTGAEMAEAVVHWTAGGEGREAAVVEGLTQLTDALQWQGEAEGAELRHRVGELLAHLGPETLGRLLSRGATPESRQALLHRLGRAGLRGEAVIPALEGVLQAEGRSLSPAMEALLRKLSERAEFEDASAGRSEARSALRDQVALLTGADPAVDDGPRSTQVGEGGEESLTMPTPLRVVELAHRVDEPGLALEAALRACVASGDVAAVLDLAEGAPADSRTALMVENFLFHPDRLKDLLSGPDVDEGSLRRVVDALGDEAIAPLFAQLAGSESRAVRRKVFDRLVALGPRISAHILEYLSADAWYVQRNMLALLQRLPSLPPGFSPVHHLRSDDVRVRREALPLAFRDPGTREEALRLALADPDERVVRGALLELQKGLPDALLEAVVEGVVRVEGRRHLCPLVARALGRNRSDRARDALVELASEARGILARRRRLGDPTPEVVAAVHALAEGWRDDPEVTWLLRAALASEHSRLRAAAETPADGEAA